MDVGQVLLLVAAGVAAGTINGVVGSGTLITYPVLLAVGVPPISANATNTTGLSVGSFSSAYAYRRELAGRRSVLIPMLAASAAGAACGALLVLALPERVFTAVIPWLILGAVVLVALQPLISRAVRQRAERSPAHSGEHPVAVTAGVGFTGIYGGYFGAAQGVILMAVLGLLYDADAQAANAAKNLMAAAANVSAAAVFVIAGRVWWPAAICVGVGALIGGTLGAHGARLLPQNALRAAVVLVGVIAAYVAWRLH